MNRLSYATYSFPYLREQFQIQMHIQTVLPALLEKTEHISCSGGMEYNLVTVLNFKIHCLLETASSRWLGRAIRSSRSSCWTPRRISKPMILSENGDMQPHSGRTLCMSTNIFLSARPFAIRCGVCTSKEKSNIQKHIELCSKILGARGTWSRRSVSWEIQLDLVRVRVGQLSRAQKMHTMDVLGMSLWLGLIRYECTKCS